jgi:hypothetical protein
MDGDGVEDEWLVGSTGGGTAARPRETVFRIPRPESTQGPSNFLHSTYEVLLVREAQPPVLAALNLEKRVNVRGINQSSSPRKVIRILVWSMSVSWCIFRW